jgi:hypothetical protein
MLLTMVANEDENDNIEVPDFIKAMHTNGSNDPPIGIRQIHEGEFAQSHFFIYSPIAQGFAQVFITESDRAARKLTSLKLFYMHDGTGYAMSSSYWNEKVYYYKFGCQHKFTELNVEECRRRGITHFGNCYHVTECSICGYIDECDSSG